MARRLGRPATRARTRAAKQSMVAEAGRTNRPGAHPATLTEDQLHRSIAELLDWILISPAVWTTFPAGWGKLPKATAGRLKASGLKEGFPDLMLFYEGSAFGIELKIPGKGLSRAQKAMRPKLEAAGIALATCSSPEEVVDCLRQWKFPLRSALINGNPTVSMADEIAKARFQAKPAQGEAQAHR